jgi:hypothetical protein
MQDLGFVHCTSGNRGASADKNLFPRMACAASQLAPFGTTETACHVFGKVAAEPTFFGLTVSCDFITTRNFSQLEDHDIPSLGDLCGRAPHILR